MPGFLCSIERFSTPPSSISRLSSVGIYNLVKPVKMHNTYEENPPISRVFKVPRTGKPSNELEPLTLATVARASLRSWANKGSAMRSTSFDAF